MSAKEIAYARRHRKDVRFLGQAARPAAARPVDRAADRLVDYVVAHQKRLDEVYGPPPGARPHRPVDGAGADVDGRGPDAAGDLADGVREGPAAEGAGEDVSKTAFMARRRELHERRAKVSEAMVREADAGRKDELFAEWRRLSEELTHYGPGLSRHR